jgi:hypothetical protein
MIRVRLNDATFVDVDADNRQTAAAAARRWFQQNRPEEFETWRRSQLGIGASARQGASAGIDQYQAGLFSAAEVLGDVTNLPGLSAFGRRGRIEQQREAETTFPSELRTPFLESEGVGDVARATTEAVAGSLPSTAAGVGGALAGARLGAPLGLPGRIGGALLGGAVGSFFPNLGQNVQRQTEVEAAARNVPSEEGRITSPGAAAAAALGQSALESAGDVATLGAARFLGRPAAEAAGSLGQRLTRGAVWGGATEVPTEIGQTALERAQAGLPLTGPEAGREYLEAGLGGLAAGSVMGGATRGLFGARPAPAPEPAPEAAPPEATTPTPSAPPPGPEAAPEAAVQPPAGPAPLTLPERPTAFTTPEEASAFLAENPTLAPPVELATPEASLGFVNAARVSQWEQQSNQLRQQAIAEFFPVAPETNAPIMPEIIGNLAVAANRGDLNLNSFSPTAVTKAALASRDIDPARVSKNEVKNVTSTLDALAQIGVIRKESPARYAINYGPLSEAATAIAAPPTPPPTPAPAPAAQAASEAAPQATTPFRVMPEPPQQGPDGRLYQRVSYEGREGYVPADELPPAAAPPAPPSPAPTPTTGAAPAPPAQRPVATAAPAPTPGPAPAPTAAPAPAVEPAAEAVAASEPATGAGRPTATAEEALFAAPLNAPIQKQKQILDKQVADGFRGGFFGKLFASPIATWSKSPLYQQSADQMDKFFVRNHLNVNEIRDAFEPALKLPRESQARIALTLQESRSKQQTWDRAAFTPEENAAMDGLIRAGQRALDYFIDAYTFRFFNPAEAKTPQQRARLDAFQAAKGNRLITDLPIAEVAAVSPEGARAVQAYNRTRDKFFFPQISRGSHFVAAYEKKPGGKEKLARIYFYDPPQNVRKLRQRIGLQRDTEAESLALLRREFPDASRYRIMTRGVESENDPRAAALRRDGDFIVRYLEELRNVSGPEAQRVIGRMSKEIDKAQMDRIFRPNNDLLRAVTPANAADYIRDVMPYYFLTAAKMQSRRYVQDDFNRSLDGYNNEEKAYWNGVLDYSSTPTEAFGTGRALAFFWFLGFNLSTATIQLTQNPTVLLPRLLRDGGGVLGNALYLKTAKDVYGTLDSLRVFGKELDYTKRLVQKGILTTDEVAALRRALSEGRLNPVQAVELRSTVSADDIRRAGLADESATAFAANANKVIDLSGRMLATVDETNRVASFLTAYRLARKRPEVMTRAGQLDNRTYADAYDYAQTVTGDTNFRSTKEDRALIQRFHPAAEMMTQFMSPVFKLLELYARSARQTVEGLRKGDYLMARASALQFAAMIAPQVMLAGIWSLPLADRLKELTEGILKLVFDDVVDFEQELEKHIGSGFWASTFNYGLPHAQGSMSLSSRLKIDPFPQGSISDWDVLSALGPVGGLVQRAYDGYQAWRIGDYWLTAGTLLPTAFGNVVKGTQLATEGEQFTKRGGRIITPADVERAGQTNMLPPSVQQALGFAPPEFSDIRRQAQRNRELQMAVREPTERVNIELGRIVLDILEADRAGQAGRADALRQRYQAREAEILREQEGKPEEYKIRIDRNAIVERARKDLLGRASERALVQGTRVPARPAAQEMYERGDWRNRQ